MVTDYQPTRNNPYLLPKTLYNRTLWHIRDYNRLQNERQKLLQDCPPPAGSPQALCLEQLTKDINAIEQALLTVDGDLRPGLMAQICRGTPYPFCPSTSTWVRQKQRFIHQVAKNLHLIPQVDLPRKNNLL